MSARVFWGKVAVGLLHPEIPSMNKKHKDIIKFFISTPRFGARGFGVPPKMSKIDDLQR